MVEHDPEDNSFIAYHKELGKGSCNGIGDTEAEAIAALKEDKKAFLELLIAEKREIPLPEAADDILPSGQIVLRMPRTLHKELKEIAAKEKVSLNKYLLSALSKTLAANILRLAMLNCY